VAQTGNIIGRNMPPRQLLARLLDCAAKAQAGELFTPVSGPLRSHRGYVHVEDVAQALVLLAAIEPKDTTSRLAFLYNVAAVESITNGEVAAMIAQAYGLHSQAQADLYASEVDTSRIRQEYRWTPQYSCREAISRVIQQAVDFS
jgi:nucleoside-diphosphate-sugar epimerase